MKNKWTAALLAWFFGGFGIHKSYLGEHGSGALRFLFFWTLIPSLLALYDVAVLAGMSKEEFDKKYNKK